MGSPGEVLGGPRVGPEKGRNPSADFTADFRADSFAYFPRIFYPVYCSWILGGGGSKNIRGGVNPVKSMIFGMAVFELKIRLPGLLALDPPQGGVASQLGCCTRARTKKRAACSHEGKYKATTTNAIY